MNVLETVLGGLVLIALVAAGIFAVGVLGAYRARRVPTVSPPGSSTDSENIHHEGEQP